MTTPPPAPSASEVYTARRARYGAARDAVARQSARLSNARAATFLGAVAGLFWAVWPGLGGGRLAAAVTTIFGLGFVGLALYHPVLERRRRWLDTLRAINAEGLARLDRAWTALPEPAGLPTDPSHPYARDLDVGGHASLLHLIGGACTGIGRDRLRAWLLAPAAPAVIVERQRAVADLAPRLDLREELQARGRLLGEATPERFERFLSWAESAPRLTARTWRMWVVRLVTLLIVGSVTLHATGAVRYPLWLAAIPLGWLLTGLWGRHVHEAFVQADPGGRLFEHYPPLFRAVGGARFEAPLLARLSTDLAASGHSAESEIATLYRVNAFADARHMWLHFVLQSLTLWDFHVLDRLESWQRRVGRHAREWFAALAEVDALGALAVLRHDHPEWAFPEVVIDADPMLEAQALAHPLLPAGTAVPNDVRIGPPGTFLLVTGSNMSGKSTLLRAIGLNAVLAQAGGPVSAAALRMPSLALATCMRVEDSLEEGLSFFMAELTRLRQVVDVAEAARDAPVRAFYLLDEILQGTNTAERQVAARHVIGRLLATGALGAVTTHDLALGEGPELAGAAQAVHFQETIVADADGERMVFDYRLRPGVATSVNALRLMRMVGL